MLRSLLSLERSKLPMCAAFLFVGLSGAAAQNPDALSPYFEGKQVTVKIDMPGTQKGVDIYPNRQPPLDAKSYGDRLKQFGVSLQWGDTVMVTKVKVNKDNVEFQLGGGGFGTAGDNSDTSVHFTSSDKSDREKDLENQISNESDPDKRRSLQRELDYVRSERERRSPQTPRDRDSAGSQRVAATEKPATARGLPKDTAPGCLAVVSLWPRPRGASAVIGELGVHWVGCPLPPPAGLLAAVGAVATWPYNIQ